MSVAEKDAAEPVGLAARLVGPHVDLRAIAVAALAASPLFAWNVADRLSYPYTMDKTALAIAVDQLQLIAWLITMSFGYAFIATGVAMFHQRRLQRLLRFSFVLTSLRVAVLLVAPDVMSQGIELIKMGGCSTDPSCFTWRCELTAFVLSSAATLVMIVLAAHFYVVWRRIPSDPRDGARFTAIAAVSLLVTVVVTGGWLIRVAVNLFDPALPILMVMLWITARVFGELIWSTGVVFLYGFIAIALVRRWQVEDRLGWVIVAAVTASLAHWLIVYGPPVAAMASAGEANWDWSAPGPRALLTSLAIGIVASPLYIYFIDQAAFRRVIERLPTTFEALRRWPAPPGSRE